MEVFIYLMRMIMLIFSLRLKGHQHLHPIFVSICGLLQAITVVVKSMKGKKKFYKLSTADLNKCNDETVHHPSGATGSLQEPAEEDVPVPTTMILSQ